MTAGGYGCAGRGGAVPGDGCGSVRGGIRLASSTMSLATGVPDGRDQSLYRRGVPGGGMKVFCWQA